MPSTDGKDEVKISRAYLQAASAKTYQQLLNNHLADYHHYFDRVGLKLTAQKQDTTTLPTDARLLSYTKVKKTLLLRRFTFSLAGICSSPAQGRGA